jgi:uncharacterized membrane protein
MKKTTISTCFTIFQKYFLFFIMYAVLGWLYEVFLEALQRETYAL